jgi:protein-tyrosine phosphatase
VPGVTSHDARFVDLTGAHNFRDLGGLPTRDGAHTRAGVMFRSDALHHLEPTDVDRLLALGMRSVIDLRSRVELERTGRGPLEATDIAWLHAPLSHSDAGVQVLPPALVEGDLGRHYSESLAERTDTLVEIITHLAAAENLPAVFHCTAGKDRTGMVAALVLSLVDVDDEVIVEDYALTDDRMALVIERIRSSGDFPEQLAPAAARIARAEASSMHTFLAAVARTYGDATGWARSAGIADDVIASLRAVLVETPE